MLNRDGERAALSTPPWFYRNQLRELPEYEKGELVQVVSRGRVIGVGFYNPLSQLTLRMVEYGITQITPSFWRKRIERAIKRRETARIESNSYRLIHSEGDGIPGLIVDKYGEYLVTLWNSAGVERWKETILTLLLQLLKPKGIYQKGDRVREKEGLSVEEGELWGRVPDRFIVEERGFKFITYLKSGQKTGFYLDQRENRKRVARWSKGGRVLDLFANSGGFGIESGGKEIYFFEASQLAVNLIEENCRLNGVANYKIFKGDLFKLLPQLDRNEPFDTIIIDPPPFAKTKKAKEGALKGWKYLLSQGLELVKEGGVLAPFSCSHWIGWEDLLSLLRELAVKKGREVEVLELLKQDVDHPYLIHYPPTLYLTGFTARVW